MGSLLDSIYKPIVVHAMSFLPRSTLKLQSKCQIWGTLSSQGVGCFAARRYTYPLLLKCFVPFLICIKNMEETPVSICNSLIDYIALFLSMLTLKLHTKCQIWGIFPSQRMGWCPVRRGIHCCWSVSYPSIDKEGSYEELLITYTSPILITLYHFYRVWLSKCTQSIRLGLFSMGGKWDDIMQR